MKYIVIAIMILSAIFCGINNTYADISIGRAETVEPVDPGTDYTQNANCVGAWYMNGTTSETDRSSGGSSGLTSSTNPPTQSSDVPSGYSGNSRLFDGDIAGYLQQADGGSLDISGADQQISILFWMKQTMPASASDFPYAINKGSTQYNIASQDSTQTNFDLRWKVGSNNLIDSTSRTYGSWIHVAYVYDDTNSYIYVNGSLVTSNGYTSGMSDNADNFRIGSNNADSSYARFNGYIDEVIIFNTGVSSTVINDIISNGIDGTKGGND